MRSSAGASMDCDSTRNRSLIIDIKGNSLDDGPGIRTVIFFKGCPLDCLWCHNPESKSPKAELSWEKEKCIACGTCADNCSEGAISPENRYFIERERCNLCFDCARSCPSQALTVLGQEMSTNEILAKLLRYKPFYSTSGGGVTLSGGEPTLHMESTSKLLQHLRSERVHTLLETCGWFDYSRFEALVLPYVNLVYFDIKLLDAAMHQRYCGVDNDRILNNFMRLQEVSSSGTFRVLARVPLIPGITDTDLNIRGIASFLHERGAHEVALLENNVIWFDKCEALGLENRFTTDDPITGLYDPERKRAIGSVFMDMGIKVL